MAAAAAAAAAASSSQVDQESSVSSAQVLPPPKQHGWDVAIGAGSTSSCELVFQLLCDPGGRDSVLVDVGAGLGRPLLHAMLQCRVRRCFGSEVDAVKCSKAEVFMDRALRQVFANGLLRGRPPARPEVLCAAVEDVATLGEATHAYSFWEGLPPDAKRGLGRLVRASGTLRAFAVVQRGIRDGPGRRGPAEELAALGFGLVGRGRCRAVPGRGH